MHGLWLIKCNQFLNVSSSTLQLSLNCRKTWQMNTFLKYFTLIIEDIVCFSRIIKAVPFCICWRSHSSLMTKNNYELFEFPGCFSLLIFSFFNVQWMGYWSNSSTLWVRVIKMVFNIFWIIILTTLGFLVLHPINLD